MFIVDFINARDLEYLPSFVNCSYEHGVQFLHPMRCCIVNESKVGGLLEFAVGVRRAAILLTIRLSDKKVSIVFWDNDPSFYSLWDENSLPVNMPGANNENAKKLAECKLLYKN